ncbi:hypothetical protein [Winogradskyella aurantiaca]|uniref:hypothetical protein n=1 Tax=Winogradskyella aurantiaca TaxID=2219558 RepID=UPI000E1D74CD|nr:hypothetical protein [Winogradskyella aurantiaca]
MVTLIKILVGIIATLVIITVDSYNSNGATNESIAQHSSIALDKSCKEKAYKILESKCNICHRKRNRRRVFTKENMDKWANDIYKQVFIKKRMPRGKNVKLSPDEYQDLLTWITTTKNSQNGNQL